MSKQRAVSATFRHTAFLTLTSLAVLSGCTEAEIESTAEAVANAPEDFEGALLTLEGPFNLVGYGSNAAGCDPGCNNANGYIGIDGSTPLPFIEAADEFSGPAFEPTYPQTNYGYFPAELALGCAGNDAAMTCAPHIPSGVASVTGRVVELGGDLAPQFPFQYAFEVTSYALLETPPESAIEPTEVGPVTVTPLR